MPVALGVAVLLATLSVSPPLVLAAPAYRIVSDASYVVAPDQRAIAIGVKLTFTNSTPNPPGRISVFNEVDLAIHDAAAQVSARDARGALAVRTAVSRGTNVATVTLRDPVRFGQSATFTLSYRLEDGKDPQVRIRPSVVVFPAWSFGTQGTVTVDLPVGYEVRSDGNPLTATTDAQRTRLTSGAIGDPTRWLALVTATAPSPTTTLTRSVPLRGATVDLQVRGWADDAAWVQRTLDLVAGALPRLEQAIGVAYPRVGPLTITESVPVTSGVFGEATSSGQELAVAFDASPFTVVHQLAHVWVGSRLVSERWIAEGLASHYAGLVAGATGATPPFDPAARAAELKAAAFPLESWGPDPASPAQDDYGYAAAWATVDRIAAQIGEAKLATAVQRIASGASPYQTDGTQATLSAAAPQAVDSRRLLDYLDAVTDVHLAPLFADSVFTPQVAGELPARATARSSYAALVNAATGWGASRPIERAMTDWRFADAMPLIAAARSWIADRDRMVADIAAVGLSTPDRLEARYRDDGGGPDARAELAAERAVVDAYRVARRQADRQPTIVERVGLIGGPDPAELLATARGRFAAGELGRALEAATRAGVQLEAAQTGGLVRLLALAALLLATAALVGYARRRMIRRSSSA